MADDPIDNSTPPTPGMSYAFPVKTVASRLKRVERTVQYRRKGQPAEIIDATGKGFRTVAASQVDRDGHIVLSSAQVAAASAPPTVKTFYGSGATAARPTVTMVGASFFDSTLGYVVWWNGSAWVDGAGTVV